MRFQTPLIEARLIRRYKRFLADVRLSDGQEVTAHCANPGAMTGLAEPGMRIWLEQNHDPKRKLGFSWKLVRTGSAHFACIDTSLANRMVAEALAEDRIAALAGYADHRREVKLGDHSRIDFLLTGTGRRDAWVEVKSVTLCRQSGLAEFPDTRTARGERHLGELAAVASAGARAVLVYVVARTDCDSVGVAADIDPGYAAAFERAMAAGVECLCLAVEMTPEHITIGDRCGLRGAGLLPMETLPKCDYLRRDDQ